MKLLELLNEAWDVYEKALELLKEGDIRDSAEKAWLAVELVRKAIMVAAKIPYEETKKISIALPVFSNLLIALDEKAFLDKYYTLQSTLHGLSFYEGILNEEATVLYIKEVEDLLKEAQKIIKKASKIDASKLLEVDKLRLKNKRAKYYRKVWSLLTSEIEKEL